MIAALFEKWKFRSGQGLGARNQGIQDPIVAEPRDGLWGLAYSPRSYPDPRSFPASTPSPADAADQNSEA